MELINGNNEPVKGFFQSLECLLDGINRLTKENKSSFGGDSFLSNREVAKLLKVSIRTLQDWRNTGIISYIQIRGRQSDIDRFLQSCYNEERQE